VEWAVSHQAQVKSICSQAGSAAWRDKLASKATRLGIFSHAVQNFLEGQSRGGSEKATNAVNLLKEAWQQLIWVAMMERRPRRQIGYASEVPFFLPVGGNFSGNGGIAFSLGIASAQGSDSGGCGKGSDFSGGGSVPGRQGNQRLGMGGPEDKPPENADKYGDGNEQGYQDGKAEGMADGINGEEHQPLVPTPLVPCPDQAWREGYNDGYHDGYNDGYDWGKGQREGG